MRPSIGVVTTNTNSLSKGYLAFFACIESWGAVADDLVIVDGGTTDRTYVELDKFLRKAKYRVIKNEQTTWKDSKFHAGQWGINNLIGIESLNTDWALIVPADHILDILDIDKLYTELKFYKNELAVRFRRKRVYYGKIVEDEKFYLINLKLARSRSLKIGWGYDKYLKHLPDDPIIISHKSCFNEYESGVEKFFFSGKKLVISKTIDSINCWSFGFYFFTIDQAHNHLYNFYKNYNFRFFGRPMLTMAELSEMEGINRIKSFSKCGLILPKEIENINDFFSPENEIIGNGVVDNSDFHKPDFLTRGFRFFNRLKLQFDGFISLERAHCWVGLNDFSKPLDLNQFYDSQDKF